MAAQSNDRKVSFPYIDEMLQQLDVNAPGLGSNFSEDIHFGFWRHPASARPAGSIAEFKTAMEALNDEVLRLAEVTSSSRIIDIGCGFGGAVNRMNQTLENATLVGLNIDERQIEVAERFCGTGVRGNQVSFTVADAQDTGLASTSFDTAIAIESILHMSHRERFFREMFRILNPGGRLVITEVLIDPLRLLPMLFAAVRHLSLLSRYKTKVGPLGSPGSMSSYRKLAGRVGFDLVAVENWAPNVLPTYASLKIVKRDEADLPGSVYAPRLLDFGARMIEGGAHKYLALCFRKPA
jgi:ubiquinone/menaquinone biosynthesis C-methylase UbiE